MSEEYDYDFGASEGAAVAKEANKGGDFQREIEFLTLKADEASVAQGKHQAIVRLVTEYERKPWMDLGGVTTKWNFAWITVKQHYAQTKQKPPYAKEAQQWPAKMYCGCRKDKVFSKRFNGQCPVCEQGSKASERSWALGIEREQVIENNQVVGIRDKTREVLEFGPDNKPIVLSEDGDKKTYKKKVVPAWVVLNFGWKNFFNALSGQAGYYKSVLGRDFVIQRSGTGNNDTNYTFIPLDPITITGEWANQIGVPEGTPYDMGHIVTEIEGRPIPLMEVLYPDMPDLRRIIAERVSDDYMGRWFIPGWVPEGFDPNQAQSNGQGVQNGVQAGYQGQFQPTGGVQQPQQPVTPQQPAAAAPAGPSASALDALKARVSGQTAASQ